MTAAKANDVLNTARKSAWDTRQARDTQLTDVMYCWYTLKVVRESWLSERGRMRSSKQHIYSILESVKLNSLRKKFNLV